MAQLITVKLSRFDSQPWGFRLQGGKDFGTPLVIQKVNVGSLAEKAGLQAGDALIRVNDVDLYELRHKESQDCIVRAGNNFELTVQRGGSTWKPSVKPVGQLPAVGSAHIQPVTKTSLAARKQDGPAIGSAHNVSARPFSTVQVNGEPTVKSIVNKQYNSPVAIYSEESIAETLSAQAEVLAGGVLGVNFKKNERNYNAANSEVFKMVQEIDSEPREPEPESPSAGVPLPSPAIGGLRHVSAPETKPPTTPHDDPFKILPPGQNICSECERLIVGVFVRIKDKNLHVECFKCATCGTSLKNVGYYRINEKLYCDIHAKLVARQNPPAPNLEPVTIPPGGRGPAGTISAAVAPTIAASTLPPTAPGNLSPQPSTLGPLPFHVPRGTTSHVPAPTSPVQAPSSLSGPKPFGGTPSSTLPRPTSGGFAPPFKPYTNVRVGSKFVWPPLKLEEVLSVPTTAHGYVIPESDKCYPVSSSSSQLPTTISHLCTPPFNQDTNLSAPSPSLNSIDSRSYSRPDSGLETNPPATYTHSYLVSDQLAKSSVSPIDLIDNISHSNLNDKEKSILQKQCLESQMNLDDSKLNKMDHYNIKVDNTACSDENFDKPSFNDSSLRTEKINTISNEKKFISLTESKQSSHTCIAQEFFHEKQSLVENVLQDKIFHDISVKGNQKNVSVQQDNYNADIHVGHMREQLPLPNMSTSRIEETSSNAPEMKPTSPKFFKPTDKFEACNSINKLHNFEHPTKQPLHPYHSPLVSALMIAPERPYSPLQSATASPSNLENSKINYSEIKDNHSVETVHQCISEFRPISQEINPVPFEKFYTDHSIYRLQSPIPFSSQKPVLREVKPYDKSCTFICKSALTQPSSATLPVSTNSAFNSLQFPETQNKEHNVASFAGSDVVEQQNITCGLPIELAQKEDIENRKSSLYLKPSAVSDQSCTSPSKLYSLAGLQKPSVIPYYQQQIALHPEAAALRSHSPLCPMNTETRCQTTKNLPKPCSPCPDSCNNDSRFETVLTERKTEQIQRSEMQRDHLSTSHESSENILTSGKQVFDIEKERLGCFEVDKSYPFPNIPLPDGATKDVDKQETIHLPVCQPISNISRVSFSKAVPKICKPEVPILQTQPQIIPINSVSTTCNTSKPEDAVPLPQHISNSEILVPAANMCKPEMFPLPTPVPTFPEPLVNSETCSTLVSSVTKPPGPPIASLVPNSGAAIGSSAPGGGGQKGATYAGSSAPRRGKGVLNPSGAAGARIPLCAHCNGQIRVSFAIALITEKLANTAEIKKKESWDDLVCESCQQAIKGPFITALGKIWCPDHFVCCKSHCRRPLADIGFVEEQGELYCEYCFEQFIAPTCDKCGKKVKGDCLNAIGKHFHPECFACSYCGKLFGNNPFFLEEGDPYCAEDWNQLFTTKCFACGFPIEAGDRWVEALNNNYHSQCFNCTNCKKNLEGQSFYAKGGRPFCKAHAR